MIEQATIHRLEKSDVGTFGVLSLDGRAFCVTLEPPDNGNARDISCIPEGVYLCKPVNSPHFGHVYEIVDVPGRTNILFHPGNIRRDTHGCVMLGRQYGTLNGERAVLTSSKTCDDFFSEAGGDSFRLRVVDVSGV